MQTEIRKQWWQQLGGMSQGMLFLQGHVAHPGTPSPEPTHRHHAHDAAGQARHREAIQRLSARRLRAMTSLSLFR
ncbi:hypothetical protein [Pseudoxanthomonas sp.]|uniref:hypothetical protein n=1 Tax=Pseudoxanthomonas sp. TaxID=1871049 RepID=UPI002FDFCCBC